MGFSTRQIHAGVKPDPTTGAILTPIYQSTTFVQPSVDEYLSKGFSYSRSGNPTVQALEARVEKADEAGVDIVAVRRELSLLQERKAAGKIHVSFFGEISSGKSSLIKALLPGAELAVSAVGGTTRDIASYSWESPSGDELILIKIE